MNITIEKPKPEDARELSEVLLASRAPQGKTLA
jgi:hypothetical protein